MHMRCIAKVHAFLAKCVCDERRLRQAQCSVPWSPLVLPARDVQPANRTAWDLNAHTSRRYDGLSVSAGAPDERPILSCSTAGYLTVNLRDRHDMLCRFSASGQINEVPGTWSPSWEDAEVSSHSTLCVTKICISNMCGDQRGHEQLHVCVCLRARSCEWRAHVRV